MKKQLTLVSSIALFTAISSVASAQVIFSDDFNRVSGAGDPSPAGVYNGPGTGFSSWGANNNALGGTITQTYFVGPTNRTGGANQIVNGQLASVISGGVILNTDFTTAAPDGFSVAFDFGRFHPFNPPADPTAGGFLAFGFGRSIPADPNTYGQNGALIGSDFGFLFQQGVDTNVGNAQFFQDSTAALTEFLPGTGNIGPVDYGDPTAQHSVLVTFTPRVSGAYGETDIIDFSFAIDGGTPFVSSVLGGSEFGRMAISSNQFVHRYIDNLVVTRLVSGPPQWNVNADGNWSTGTNWTGGTSPNGASANALLGTNAQNRTITLDVPVTLDTLTVNNPGSSYTIDLAGANKLTTASIEVDAGTLNLNDSSSSRNAAKTGSLTVAASQKLNLQRGMLVVDYTGSSPLSTLVGYVASGQLDAEAQAIAVVEASDIAGLTSFGGVTVDATSVLIRGTFGGDANVDGAVNFTDLVELARNYNVASGATWADGDTNYDGAVNFTDLVELARNYNAALPGAEALNALGGASFAADWASALALIPEPSSLLALAGIGGLVMRRRR